jgi:hypothetical protein
MAPPLLWLLSDAAANVTGRRFLAIHWDTRLSPEEAAEKAGAPVAWTSIATMPITPADRNQSHYLRSIEAREGFRFGAAPGNEVPFVACALADKGLGGDVRPSHQVASMAPKPFEPAKRNLGTL